jgi:hypothetical protein
VAIGLPEECADDRQANGGKEEISASQIAEGVPEEPNQGKGTNAAKAVLVRDLLSFFAFKTKEKRKNKDQDDLSYTLRNQFEQTVTHRGSPRWAGFSTFREGLTISISLRKLPSKPEGSMKTLLTQERET